ncbi:Uncharacterised protein [Vibrio cholerae]|uniref:Uncharacterized protein n=1 Tax=Vibrio cholerae TaxID=666 RepID=A0A656ALH7_VIBCL|nr:Uncharacterised protein [Vibrio cholerae]CSD18438.1 Uncharacterised protein [Vibrio cholerae]CSI32739.1 Uncharacterised protein [Vibrio cholerae]
MCAKTYARSVRDTNTCRDHVIDHFREFVDAIDCQHSASQTRFDLALCQFWKINGAFIGPCDVVQQTENPIQYRTVWFNQTVRNQL